MEHIAWMAWTLPTAIFFVMLAMTLAVMTWLAVAYPEAERVGILRIPTTRGDRLFISLIMTAVIHLLWIGFVGTEEGLTPKRLAASHLGMSRFRASTILRLRSSE